MTHEPENKSSSISPWVFVSEGMQLAVTLLLFLYVGLKLDDWKKCSPLFTLVGAFVGILLGLTNFLRRFLKK